MWIKSEISMDSKELRIGNILNYKGYFWKVWDISQGTICFDNDNPTAIYDIRTLEPIHITEEWLKKFGIKYYHKFNSNGEYFLCDTDDGPILLQIGNPRSYGGIYLKPPSYFGDERIKITEVTYVHELQNLYFCLTREELTYDCTRL